MTKLERKRASLKLWHAASYIDATERNEKQSQVEYEIYCETMQLLFSLRTQILQEKQFQ